MIAYPDRPGIGLRGHSLTSLVPLAPGDRLLWRFGARNVLLQITPNKSGNSAIPREEICRFFFSFSHLIVIESARQLRRRRGEVIRGTARRRAGRGTGLA